MYHNGIYAVKIHGWLQHIKYLDNNWYYIDLHKGKCIWQKTIIDTTRFANELRPDIAYNMILTIETLFQIERDFSEKRRGLK